MAGARAIGEEIGYYPGHLHPEYSSHLYLPRSATVGETGEHKFC